MSEPQPFVALKWLLKLCRITASLTHCPCQFANKPGLLWWKKKGERRWWSRTFQRFVSWLPHNL